MYLSSATFLPLVSTVALTHESRHNSSCANWASPSGLLSSSLMLKNPTARKCFAKRARKDLISLGSVRLGMMTWILFSSSVSIVNPAGRCMWCVKTISWDPNTTSRSFFGFLGFLKIASSSSSCSSCSSSPCSEPMARFPVAEADLGDCSALESNGANASMSDRLLQFASASMRLCVGLFSSVGWSACAMARERVLPSTQMHATVLPSSRARLPRSHASNHVLSLSSSQIASGPRSCRLTWWTCALPNHLNVLNPRLSE